MDSIYYTPKSFNCRAFLSKKFFGGKEKSIWSVFLAEND